MACRLDFPITRVAAGSLFEVLDLSDTASVVSDRGVARRRLSSFERSLHPGRGRRALELPVALERRQPASERRGLAGCSWGRERPVRRPGARLSARRALPAHAAAARMKASFARRPRTVSVAVD